MRELKTFLKYYVSGVLITLSACLMASFFIILFETTILQVNTLINFPILLFVSATMSLFSGLIYSIAKSIEVLEEEKKKEK